MRSHYLITDLKLVDLLKNGDESAYSEIYSRYAENLAGFASSKLYSLEDAKDIVHDVFVNLWLERKMLRVDYDLKAYLFKLTRFRVVDKIRKNITREVYSDMIQNLATSFELTTEQQFAAKELKQTMERSLVQLSPRIVEIFRLSREEHLSIPEIAEKLQLSEQTVKNQLSTALKHLRGALTSLSAIALTIYFYS